MYNFLFDRKTLMLLLAGLGLAGALLFFAGVLVGVQVGLPPASGAVAIRAPQRPEPPTKPAPASMPTDCVCPPATEMASVRTEPCPEPAPEEPQAVEPAPVPAEEPAVVASLPAPEPEPVEAPEPVEETVAEEVQPAAFSIQVGAFRSPENSAKALEELRNRGYEPYVVELPGSRNRVLHTVRVGRYADRDEALRAAADFRRREGMAAVVERVGS
jgi:cell division protein FtsN